MKIRAKTLVQWLKANFTRSELISIADNGADRGWKGLIYYDDTSKIYTKFKNEIWEHIIEKSQENCNTNPFNYLALFQSAKVICDAETLEYWLVCYAIESLADQIVNR